MTLRYVLIALAILILPSVLVVLIGHWIYLRDHPKPRRWKDQPP